MTASKVIKKPIFLPRKIAPACGFWNYNGEDDTYTISNLFGRGKVKVTANFAERHGWIIRR